MSYDFFAAPATSFSPAAPAGSDPHPPPSTAAAASAVDRWGTPLDPASPPAREPDPRQRSVSAPSQEERLLLAQGEMYSRREMGAPVYHPVGARLSLLGGFGAGRQLAAASWSVVAAEPWLLLVPTILLVGGSIAVTAISVALDGLATDGPLPAVLEIALFVAMFCVSTLARAIVVSAATDCLDDRRTDFRQAWGRTLAHLPDLLVLGTIFAAQRLVSMALRRLRLGWLVAAVIDGAWDFATYLAVPTILFEDVGALRAIRRSGALVSSRWGTQLSAQGVIGIFLFLCAVPAYAIAIFVAGSLSLFLGVVLFLITLLTVSVLASTLSAVLSAAMYRFTTTGLLTGGFSEADLRLVLSRA